MYGWKIENCLVPVHSELAAAPDDILKMIFCRCTKDCASAKCGCKKASLKCSQACHNCQGNCLNAVSQVASEDEEDQEDPVTVSLQESDGVDDSETKDENEDEDQSPFPIKKVRN